MQPIRGRFSVREVFGELNAPLFKDRPFAHLLSVGAAGRLSDYSTIGSTKTWQFNGIYAPVRDLSFRGSSGEAVRAPNIGELFTPSAASTNFIIDPCGLSLRDNGSSFRPANCATLLTALGVDPATYAPVSGGASDGDGTAFGRFQGNPDLGAETARTWTAGVVLRPRFLRGFTASADWYDIRLKGAVSTPGAQTITELCVDQPSLDNVYCDALTRRQGTGKVIGYTVQPQNVSECRTAGLDVNLAYPIRTERFGRFDLRFVGGYLHRLDIIATPGAAVEDQVGQVGRPKFTATFSPTWTLGAVTLAYNLRWIDNQRRFAKAVTDGEPDFAPADVLRHREAWLHDLQAQLSVSDHFAFYGGVNNLANQKPDEDAYDTPVPALGRFF